jgi:hypothetical protein
MGQIGRYQKWQNEVTHSVAGRPIKTQSLPVLRTQKYEAQRLTKTGLVEDWC